MLEVLVKSPGSTDSLEIHQTILGICAPQIETSIRTFHPDKFESVLKLLDRCPESSFTIPMAQDARLQDNELLDRMQSYLVTLITSHSVDDSAKQSPNPTVPAMVRRAIEARGVEATLRALIGVLLQLSDSNDFLFSLDAVATVVTVAGSELRDVLRLQYGDLATLLRKGDTLSAEAVVRLWRLVEAFTNILAIHDIPLDSFAFTQQLTNIDTTNPNLDGGATASGGMDSHDEATQADGIDQVLDEVAAMGNMDPNDADMNFDALYGLQSTDMDLNDLDLDMF